MQNCLSCKSSISWEYSKTFRLQICLSRKSSISWEYSKTFSPVKLSQPQIINILGNFKDFFAFKFVLAANHQYPGKFQRVFRMQNCLSCKSSISWEYSKTFRLQICLSRKSSISWEISKTFLPSNLSQPQIINILGIFKNFFACKIVLAANRQYPGKFQRVSRLQNCLSCKSSISWEYSKTFLPAILSQPQIINILGIFRKFFACKIVLAANHQYPGKFQRVFRMQNCLSCKSSISWEYSKTFLPANLSQPQIINILGIFKNFFACKIVLAANHQYPGNI